MKKAGLAGLISPAVRLSSTSQGYMTPFRDTRYHKTHFRGVDIRTLDRQEKFNYIHLKLRNVIERRFGHFKERWHILEGVPFFRWEKQA